VWRSPVRPPVFPNPALLADQEIADGQHVNAAGAERFPENNPNPWHNLLTTDLRFDRPIKLGRLREGMEIVPFVNFFNLFNHAPAGLYGGLTGRFGALNFDYAAAPAGQKASDLDAQRHRITGTRRVEIGVRFNF